MRSLPLGLFAFLLVACSSSSDDTTAKPKPVNCDPTEDAHAPERSACSFAAGALPKSTLGCSMIGKRLPFEHVILIMQENRSFDHYFQTLPGVNVAPPNTTVPAPDGSPVPFVHK